MFAPTTNVRVLQNVDCDPSGNNVLSFASKQDETNYYIGKTKFNYSTCHVEGAHGYVGHIILPGTPEQYYDCNYIMWNNAQFTDKWFYAYLNNIEPYANGASYGTYVIDMFRTWYWEHSLGQCLVARENVNDDTIGRWLLPENIEAGEYVCASSGDLLSSLDMTPKLVIVYSYSPAQEDDDSSETYTVGGQIMDVAGAVTGAVQYNFLGLKPVFAGGMVCEGIYQGARFLAMNCDSISDRETIDKYIQRLVGQGQISKILTMFMAPAFAVTHATAIPVDTFSPFSVVVPAITRPTAFGSYTPKNKKLLTQQYNFLLINNNVGTQEEYGYEYFSGGSGSFKAYAALSQSPTIRLMPIDYKGVEENNLYQVDLSGFPMASFSYSQLNNDTAANMWSRRVAAASDIYGSVMNIAQSAIGAIPSPTSKNPVGDMVSGVVNTVDATVDAAFNAASAVAEYHDKRRIPNIVQGVADGNITFSMGKMTFNYYKMQIQPQFAKKVDDYLSAYGYRVDEFKQPNVSGRANWNYLQLVNPVIQGNLPYDAKQVLFQQYSRGIRIWHNPANFMNFTADNSIV